MQVKHRKSFQKKCAPCSTLFTVPRTSISLPLCALFSNCSEEYSLSKQFKRDVHTYCFESFKKTLPLELAPISLDLRDLAFSLDLMPFVRECFVEHRC